MATWVPPEQQDLRWRIWNELFHVRVPNIHTRSKEHIKAFGSPTSGDPIRDRQAANELLDTSISIAKMVIYHHQGVLVRLVKVSDAKIIYEAVVEYLSGWKNHLSNSLVKDPEAPYEDLIAMNNFIQAVYPHAEAQLTPALEESWLSKKIHSIGGPSLTLRGVTPPEPAHHTFHDTPDVQRPTQPNLTMAEKMFSSRRQKW